jgi:8-oxo-dGTP pyrophosphatase MutT (NUDIX family)
MITELWQLYSEQGEALMGAGAGRNDVYSMGLLHAASHVWIWRRNADGVEVLLQRRAGTKRTWPNCYDISAAGHIDLNEPPVRAALREVSEEIGLRADPDRLQLAGVHRAHLVSGGAIENEFQWLYLLELTEDMDFVLQTSEVDSLAWLPLAQFRVACQGDDYVPHGALYYDTVLQAIDAASGTPS